MRRKKSRKDEGYYALGDSPVGRSSYTDYTNLGYSGINIQTLRSLAAIAIRHINIAHSEGSTIWLGEVPTEAQVLDAFKYIGERLSQ